MYFFHFAKTVSFQSFVIFFTFIYDMQNNYTLNLLKENEFWVTLKTGMNFLITDCDEKCLNMVFRDMVQFWLVILVTNILKKLVTYTVREFNNRQWKYPINMAS